MVIDRLGILLSEHGYLKLESQMPEFQLFLAGNFERAQLVEVIDLSQGYRITREQLQMVIHNTQSAFEDQGYRNLHAFTLILTHVTDQELLQCAEESACWIVDLSRKEIVPYEGQTEDFYGIKGMLERAMDETCVIEAPTEEEEVGTEPQSHSGERNGTRGGLLDFIRRNYTSMNTLIVAVNVIVFIVLSFLGNVRDAAFMAEHGAMYAPYVLENGEYYRLITCMFLHFGIDHLMSNMIGLYFLGDNLERAVGRIKYLVIYFMSGILASMGSMLYYLLLGQPVVSAGASGAIFGVIGAVLYIVIRNKGKLEDITTFRIVIFIGFCLYSGLTSPATDNAAHLCGLLVGFLLSVLLYRKPKSGRDTEELKHGN